MQTVIGVLIAIKCTYSESEVMGGRLASTYGGAFVLWFVVASGNRHAQTTTTAGSSIWFPSNATARPQISSRGPRAIVKSLRNNEKRAIRPAVQRRFMEPGHCKLATSAARSCRPLPPTLALANLRSFTSHADSPLTRARLCGIATLGHYR